MFDIDVKNAHAFAISKETDHHVTKTKILLELVLPNRDGFSNFYFELHLEQVGRSTECNVEPIFNVENYFNKYNITNITDYAFSTEVTQKIINVSKEKIEPYIHDFIMYNDSNDSYNEVEAESVGAYIGRMMAYGKTIGLNKESKEYERKNK